MASSLAPFGEAGREGGHYQLMQDTAVFDRAERAIRARLDAAATAA